MNLQDRLFQYLVGIISETNGVSLVDSLDLLATSRAVQKDQEVSRVINDFRDLIGRSQINQVNARDLLPHPVALALRKFFLSFPMKYREEHIHLTGSLTPEFVAPKLQALLAGPHAAAYRRQIEAVFGAEAKGDFSPSHLNKLMRLKESERFDRYLKILLIPKLILVDRQAHADAAYHMASELYHRHNVGYIRLKFTLSRSTTDPLEKIPGLEGLQAEDVVLGLHSGFSRFQKENRDFRFILSPCFRKEPGFFDSLRFRNKKEDFEHQVTQILKLIDQYPDLRDSLREVDTVGSEKELYRKTHFMDMKTGFRKLQTRGFQIRSHHGETWATLRRGIQSVDNAMNIWRVDALEHGVSLGINPNVYFQKIFERVMTENSGGKALSPGTPDYDEIVDMDWHDRGEIKEKILKGEPLNSTEETRFIKIKFHTAQEVEHYQHDILNRMINKNVSLIALPSSNKKLTGQFDDGKEHPFSWWEKKSIKLGVGTDNYVTLNTDFVQEMLLLLFNDPQDLKIMKLLLVTTGDKRRPYISQFLWQMRQAATAPG